MMESMGVLVYQEEVRREYVVVVCGIVELGVRER